MILSNISIHEALDRGWLKLAPEPIPRRKTVDGPKCPFQTSAVDLRLGTEISYFKEGIPAQIDLRKGDFNAMFGPLSETRSSPKISPLCSGPVSWFWVRPWNAFHCRSSPTARFPLPPASRERVLMRTAACSFTLPHPQSTRSSTARSHSN